MYEGVMEKYYSRDQLKISNEDKLSIQAYYLLHHNALSVPYIHQRSIPTGLHSDGKLSEYGHQLPHLLIDFRTGYDS